MTTFPLRSASGQGGPAAAGPLLRGPAPIWLALYANVLTFMGPTLLMPLPTPVGQLITQAMLPLALVLALLANPGVVLRMNFLLVLFTVMAVLALMVSLHGEFVIGSTYRAVRLVLFVCVLWLLTPWWGRKDMPLLRVHLTCLRLVTASVLIGGALAPGAAVSTEGRLKGTFWPIPPPQVGHYAAILVGVTVVLWFTGSVQGRTTMLTLVGGGAALLLSHTRTALAAMLVGLVVAGISLFVGHARVRRTAVVSAVVAVVAGTLLGSVIRDWLARGQDSKNMSQLTGRTKVWSAVANYQRNWLQECFGIGLSNKSFNGLPIDSNWVATSLELGWAGMAVQVAFLLSLALTAVTRPRGPRRAIALFILGYCLVASFTETGLGDASPYLLDLVVAASLLARPVRSPAPGAPVPSGNSMVACSASELPFPTSLGERPRSPRRPEEDT
jgi:hypothetical protein